MKVYQNEGVVDWMIGRIRAKMSDDSRFSGPFHASDLTRCLRQTILIRKYRPVPTKEDIPKLAQGFALQEWYFGPEEDGVLYVVHSDDCPALEDEEAECEDPSIIFSADHISGDNIIEMKSTQRGHAKFLREDSIHTQEGWIMRTRMYCAVHEINTAHIVVQFKGYPDSLDAWTFEFTDEELEEARKEIAKYADVLKRAEASGRVPAVSHRKWAFECNYCPFFENFCKDKLEAAEMEIAEAKYRPEQIKPSKKTG